MSLQIKSNDRISESAVIPIGSTSQQNEAERKVAENDNKESSTSFVASGRFTKSSSGRNTNGAIAYTIFDQTSN